MIDQKRKNQERSLRRFMEAVFDPEDIVEVRCIPQEGKDTRWVTETNILEDSTDG
jgi:hypothetical protein